MEITPALSYAIGFFVGDGNLWTNNRWYELSFTGDKKEDVEVFEFLQKTLKESFSCNPRLVPRPNCIRLVIRSKTVFKYFTSQLGFKAGRKAFTTSIPASIVEGRHSREALQGLFDADGTVFFSNKPGSPDYPAIEMKTVSKPLATQVFFMLKTRGFTPRANERIEINPTYKIALYGWKNAARWHDTIGSKNPKKAARLYQAKIAAEQH